MASSTAVFLEKVPPVPDAEVDQLEKLIRSRFTTATGFDEPHNISNALQKSFLSFETLEGNCVTIKEFYSALNKMNCGGNRTVVQKLFERYDRKGTGKITVKEFANGLMGIQPPPQASPEFRAFLERLRDVLQKRYGGTTTFRALTRTLRIMDDNGNRSLEPEEVRTGLGDLGIHLSDAELQHVFRTLDRDNSGAIDVTEFIVAVRGTMSAPRRELVRRAFLRLEKTNDGKVTLEDLRLIYKTDLHPLVLQGKKTPDDVLRDFMKDWNKNGDDEITLDEFCEYYDDISASIDSDTYFELMIRNAWHIAGGEGMANCTTTRRVLVHHLNGTSTIEEIVDDLGVDWKDDAQVRSRLRRQGITDILRVELYG